MAGLPYHIISKATWSWQIQSYGEDFGNNFDRMFLYVVKQLLIVGLEHLDFFHSVGNVIIPTDELHHFSEGRYTTNQSILPTNLMI